MKIVVSVILALIFIAFGFTLIVFAIQLRRANRAEDAEKKLANQKQKRSTMKNSIPILVIVAFSAVFTSCETVSPGHKGVEVSWGGETNLQTIYPEGMNGGFHWMFDDLVEYDVREKTVVDKFQFNDKNNMVTGVEVSLDHNLNPSSLAQLHTQIKDIDVKILKTLKSACKEVIPQYTASELNLTKRGEAEKKLSDILSQELPEFYVEFARVQLTDVDIPDGIAATAEATAKQLELNKLSEKKAEESENNFKAAEWDAKTKAVLSKPEMLELQRVENERLMWSGFVKHGHSPYGVNNIFGSETSVVRGLK
jgi:regulator of protease activity HflC (stomatin/prohibitin superfamily)